MALFPARFAREGDAVLILDSLESEPIQSAINELEKGGRRMEILTPGQKADWSRFTAEPWGWNPLIRRILADGCLSLQGIKSEDEIAMLRQLAHRSTTIPFLEEFSQDICPGIELPRIFDDAGEAFAYWGKHGNLFFKQPWSSSGRGVIRTDQMNPTQIESWLRGSVRGQGSVLAEPMYDKKLDFATEWLMRDGEAIYLGLSIFNTSFRGKYHGNLNMSQEEMKERIRNIAPGFGKHVMAEQKRILEEIVGIRYKGHLGIDMMALGEGYVHPCVEINFRRTMGSVLLSSGW